MNDAWSIFDACFYLALFALSVGGACWLVP